MRAPANKTGRQRAASSLCARLAGRVALDVEANGKLAARFDGFVLPLGTFSAGAVERARQLRSGLPLASFASRRRSVDKEVDLLARRLARYGLLEYPIGGMAKGRDLAVIEPQLPDYWPRAAPLSDGDVLVLSRFAYLRRRGNEMVLESPRAGALFRIGDAKIAAVLAALVTPQQVKALRGQRGFVGVELLGLLLDCGVVFKVGAGAGLRADEGGDDLVLWDFHDLLFHARSTQGRHANPLGGTFPHTGVIAPKPAVRSAWPGEKIDLTEFAGGNAEAGLAFAKLLRERHSTRSFNDHRPITLAELARFLDGTARVLSRSSHDLGDGGPVVEYAARPYPSAGAAYPLELYLAVDICAGLPRGFYHYDAGAHALVPVAVGADTLGAQLSAAAAAMDVPVTPQILITIAARFGRTSWKYSSIAYALILKDAGVLLQSFYLMATDLGLGGCAVGIADIDQFEKMTGMAFHVEGPVGQFALGRPAPEDGSG